MTTRREFLKQTSAAGLGVGACTALSGTTTGGARPETSRTAKKSGIRIKSVARREDTIFRYGGNGDNWNMSWAADDRQYVSLCDGAGFVDPPKEFYNSRMLAISGGPQDAEFHDVHGYPKLARPAQNYGDTRYYNFGTLAVDGHLYQFLSTFNRAFRRGEMKNPNLNDVVRFIGAKLIYSPDSGRTWHNQNASSPVVWEPWANRSRDTMVFFDEEKEAFSLLAVLQMGRNYEHNRDGYIYVYAPNGNTEGTMNELVMFRAPKLKLLDRGSYEYFAGMDASHNARWTKNIVARATVHSFPKGWVNKLAHPYAWHPSVVYNAPLNLYMMANWGMGTTPSGMWFGKPSYLGFWIANNPWGPWEQIHEETAWMPANDKNARAYEPQIAPKWIAPDGKSFWLVWTDFQGYDSEGMKRSQGDGAAAGDASDVVNTATRMKRYMPYYAFNVQRVDLVI